jgi:hypothetical protein
MDAALLTSDSIFFSHRSKMILFAIVPSATKCFSINVTALLSEPHK